MEDIDKKFEKAKEVAKAKDKKDEQRIDDIQKRLATIERNLEITRETCKKRDREQQTSRTNEFKRNVGLEVIENEEEPKKKAKTWTELIEHSKNVEKEKRDKEATFQQKVWRKQVQVRQKVDKMLEDAPEPEKEKVMNLEKEIQKEKETNELKVDEFVGHNEEDWSWSECEDDWEGTEDRRESEKMKKIKRYRRRKLVQFKTAKKAKHMIGLGPILRDSIGYFHNITSDYEEAKRMAVNEFLMTYLQISEEDLKYFDIVETTIAKNDEELLYVTFRDHDSIKDIYSRAAELKNDDLMTRIFVPPQFWDRYRHINQYCAQMRADNRDIKNQIRFGDEDIEVLVKNRMEDDRYSILPLDTIEKDGSIPKFNHSIVWKKRKDKPSRPPLKPVKGKIIPPSMQPASARRHSSTSSENVNPKKRKQHSISAAGATAAEDTEAIEVDEDQVDDDSL